MSKFSTRTLAVVASVAMVAGGGFAAAMAPAASAHDTHAAASASHPSHHRGHPSAGLAATPQMGWNDWNAFGCDVSAKLVEQTADEMVANGMKAAGYEYVNIDDCWQEKQRDANGNLVPDPTKFPDGMKAVADYVHSKGLKLGIYEDAGSKTCAGYPGSLGHEKQDAASFASWDVDYLKYDNCYNEGSSTRQQYIDRYQAMADALKATGRTIFYSLCEWGDNDPWTWAGQVGNSWRTTGDINDSYGSMLSIFQKNVWLYPYAGPKKGWNDPDMLEVGNGGMTTEEYKAEFSLWAEMAAPLISGGDLRSISKTDLAIYTNKRVIAVDQDRLGEQGEPVAVDGKPAGDNGIWVLTKKLANGDRSVVLFNSTGTRTTISTTASEVGLPRAGSYKLDDLWTGKTTRTAGTIAASVPAHGAVMYRVSTHASSAIAPDVAVTMDGLAATIDKGSADTVTVKATDHAAGRLDRVDLKVGAPKGWTVKATSRTSFRGVRTGQTVSATFAVTPTAPTQPIETAQVSAEADYSWAAGRHHEKRATAEVTQQTTTTSPVTAPYKTFSSASDAPAGYGQVGDDFAVSGGGADLWGGSDDYTAIYKPGAVDSDATVETEVTGTPGLSGFGKAGILVRNSVTDAGKAPEGVILFVSPTGGIQLEWNSDSDASIDSVTPANGTITDTTPVHLKLVRSGSTYTGYYSTDGSTWTKVGSADVPGQAATQDAALFVTSHSSGTPAQADFTGFTVE